MKKSFISIFMMMFIAMAFDWLGKIFPDEIYSIFAYPAACVASLFWSAHPVFIDKQDILIPLGNHAVHVIPACSGYGFFCLLLAMTMVYSLRSQHRAKIFYSIAAFPAAYLLTIMINGCRIICAYEVHEVTKWLLPSNFHAAMHQGIGIILFLTTLMGVSLILERKFCHERSR